MDAKTQLSNALAVVILSRRSREWLIGNDPKALAQAIKALRDTGWRTADGLDIDQAIEAAVVAPEPGAATPED